MKTLTTLQCLALLALLLYAPSLEARKKSRRPLLVKHGKRGLGPPRRRGPGPGKKLHKGVRPGGPWSRRGPGPGPDDKMTSGVDAPWSKLPPVSVVGPVVLPGVRPSNRPPPAFSRKHHHCGCQDSGLERNISLLWKHIQYMSRPVNVYIRGEGGHSHRGHSHRSMKSPNSKSVSQGNSSDSDQSPWSGTKKGRGGKKGHSHRGHTHHDHSHVGHSHLGHSHKGHSHVGHSHMGHSHFGPSHAGHSHKGHSHGHSHHGHHGEHDTNIFVYLKLSKEKGGKEEKCKDKSKSKSKSKSSRSKEYRYARCDLSNTNDLSDPEKRSMVAYLQGGVQMRQRSGGPLEVKINISGINDALFGDLHQKTCGLHVHTFSGPEGKCSQFGGHFNPDKNSHGFMSNSSHPGDWGNVMFNWVDKKGGVAMETFNTTFSTLFGPESLVGRGIVLHENEDDLGQGGDAGSLASGNAGPRISCCTIGWAKPDQSEW